MLMYERMIGGEGEDDHWGHDDGGEGGGGGGARGGGWGNK